MTTPADEISLFDGDSVVAALPHLLGFRPTDSLVLLWFDGARLRLTERIDIPSPGGSSAGRVHGLVPEDAVNSCTGVVAVLVTDMDGDVSDAVTFADAVCAHVHERGLAIFDLVLTSGDHWRSLYCEDPRCCPPEGRVISAKTRAAAAERFAFTGRRILADRAAVAAQVAVDPAAAAQTAIYLPASPRRPRRGDPWRDGAITAIIEAVTGRPGSIQPNRRARLMYDLADIRVRDTVLWDLANADLDAVARASISLAMLTRSAPEAVCAPVATCCAIASWLVGDSVLASASIDRALAVEPDYGLALLVRSALQAGWPAVRWREIMGELDRRTCRTGDLPSGRPSV